MTTFLIVLGCIAVGLFAVIIIVAWLWSTFISPLLTDGTEDDPFGNPNDPPGDFPHYPALPSDWPGRCEPPVKGRAG